MENNLSKTFIYNIPLLVKLGFTKSNHVHLKSLTHQLISTILQISCQICIYIKVLLVAISRNQLEQIYTTKGVWWLTSKKINNKVGFRGSLVMALAGSPYHNSLSSFLRVSHVYPQSDLFYCRNMAAEIPGLTSACLPYVK